jgi:tRNA-specific 2-thiouridylase
MQKGIFFAIMIKKMSTALKGKKVAVAMSGGVDSSVAALLLQGQGLEVVGLNMYLGEGAPETSDAERAAQSLGIKLYRVNMEKIFEKEVIEIFIREYITGRTPNPCVLCNQRIKFRALWQKAQEIGAVALATGHYARIERSLNSGTLRLFRGIDPGKDQSYFLFTMTQQQLERTAFPLGNMKKSEVQKLAKSEGLPVTGRRESQDLCFISEKNHRDFIRTRIPERVLKPGEIVDEQGRALGKHQGIFCYTVGQRKGLGDLKALGYYVLALRPEQNQVVVGHKNSLFKQDMYLREVHWISDGACPEIESEGPGGEVQVQIRYNSPPAPALVRTLTHAVGQSPEAPDHGKAHVRFIEPQAAITPGQAAVFFRGQEVLGGGWIE